MKAVQSITLQLAVVLAASQGFESLSAEPTGTGASGPKIQFEKTILEFGQVMAGAIVRHDFVFTNVGTSVLEIKEVKPGCGCTTAGTWDKRVEPGKTGKIPLQLNSTGFAGPITKSATIICNDPGRSNVLLQIKGTVWRQLEITPSTAVFNLPSDGQTNETKVIRIVNNTDAPLMLSDLQCTNQAFRAELKTVKEGKEFELHVSTVTPITAPSLNAPITLKSSLTNQPTIRVMAYAVVQAAVVLSPAQITLPGGPLKNPETRPILIRGTGSDPLVVSDLGVNVPGVELSVSEVQPGKVFRVMAKFPAGFQIASGQKVEITAKTNHPKHAQVRVPVLQSQFVARPSSAPSAPVARPKAPTTNQGAPPLPPAVTKPTPADK